MLATEATASPEPSAAHGYRFDVFISYATVPDARLVRGLEKFLERFHRLRLPGGETLRPLQVCVDGTDFALRRLPKASLGAVVEHTVERAIEVYLEQSRYLLVCCSSGSLTSRYVEHEVQWFLKHRGADSILLAVTEGGDMAAAMERFRPIALRGHAQHGFSYDLRGWHRWRRRWERWSKVRNFGEARVRLVADLLEVECDSILQPWRLEEIKRRARLTVATLVAAGLVAAAMTLAAVKMNDTWQARRESQSRGMAATATALGSSDPELAVLLAGEALDRAHTPEAERALREATGASRIRQHMAVAGARGLRDAAWSADGERVLTVALLADGTDQVQVWDPSSGQPDGPPLLHGGAVETALFAPDSRSILTLGRDRSARLWQRDRNGWRRTERILRHADAVVAGAVDPSGRRVALGDASGAVSVWNLGASDAAWRVATTNGEPTGLSFSPDGARLAWAAGPEVWTWNLEDGQPALAVALDRPVQDVMFTPDGAQLLISAGNSVEVWTPGAVRVDMHLYRAARTVRSARVRAQGDLVAIALDDGTVPIVSLAGGAEVVTLRGHERTAVRVAAFSPDGQEVLTASDDRTARVWSVAPRAMREIDHQALVADVAFSADGALLATADASAWQARIWSPDSGLQRDLRAEYSPTTAVGFSPDRTQPCTLLVGEVGGAQLWDACRGTPGAPLGQTDGAVTRVALDPTGRLALLATADTVQVVAIAGGALVHLPVEGELREAAFVAGSDAVAVVDERQARLQPVRSGAPAQPLPVAAPIAAAALSGDGRVLAVAGGDGVQRFDATSGRSLGPRWPAGAPVRALAIAADGTAMAVATEAHVALLDDERSAPLAQRRVEAIAFDPAGELVATASRSGTLRIWSVASGAEVARTQFSVRGSEDRERVEQLLFAPGGEVLVARGNGPTVRVYGREIFRPLADVQALARERVARPLTAEERELYVQASARWWWP